MVKDHIWSKFQQILFWGKYRQCVGIVLWTWFELEFFLWLLHNLIDVYALEFFTSLMVLLPKHTNWWFHECTNAKPILLFLDWLTRMQANPPMVHIYSQQTKSNVKSFLGFKDWKTVSNDWDSQHTRPYVKCVTLKSNTFEN